MKNFILILFLLLIFGLNASAQSNFDIGFKAGFGKGYCYTNSNPPQSYGICVPPLAPLPPLLGINESSDNYQDGYNRGFLYGQAQRRAEEIKSSSESYKSPDPPKFNPYVPQNPTMTLTLEERSAYYSAKARQDQATAEAIGYLLEYIFTVTPEERVRRDENKKLRTENRKLKRKVKEGDKKLNQISKDFKKLIKK